MEGKELMGTIRKSLEEFGFDFTNREAIEDVFSEVLELAWEDLSRREAELAEQLKDVFREAGATEAQLAWGMLEQVQLGWKAQWKVRKLAKEIDKVREEFLPVAGLAAVLNEARALL